MPVNEVEKKQAIAASIAGEVVDDEKRVAICIRGTVLGFPARYEAIGTSWPFGSIYTVETGASFDPNESAERRYDSKITIYPRVGRGLMGLITKVLLFESSSQPIGDKKLESMFNFSYDSRGVTEQLFQYPGVAENLTILEDISKFSELIIRTNVGLYLSQPTSFNALDTEQCKTIFRALAEIGQALVEAF